MKNKEVSIATKPLVYAAFRHISNKVWCALGEYVDNSIQSFLDHREVLSKINKDGKLHVNIVIGEKEIVIEDDAFGITNDKYVKAFELANLPLDDSGLNEFGMGMKISSIWLSNLWTVETAAYDEEVSKTIIFDVEKVGKQGLLSLPINEASKLKTEHYTRVKLTNLSSNKPSPGQISTIKKHITSIYTKFIREELVEIKLNGEILEDVPLPILKAPYYKDKDKNEIEWKINVDFKAGKYSVTGYIALLETMSTNTNNGLLLFRRNRVIGTSYNDRYRPVELCGNVGSPLYKRLFGELFLEGFNVSFTKNSFQQADDDLITFIKMLKDKIISDNEIDIFGQGQNYRKPTSDSDKKKIEETMKNQMISSYKQQQNKPLSNILQKAKQKQIQNEQKKEENVKEYNVNTSEELNTIVDPQRSYNPKDTVLITLSGENKVKLCFIWDDNIEDLYKLEKRQESDDLFNTPIYNVIINKSNIIEKYQNLFDIKEGTDFFVSFIRLMVNTELFITEEEHESGIVRFRQIFNDYYKDQL